MHETHPVAPVTDEIIIIPKDDDDFRAFIGTYLPVMEAVARQYQNAQPEEDTLQESLLKAWLHPTPLRGASAQPWLTTITANTGRDAYRKTMRRNTVTPTVDTRPLAEIIPDPDDSVEEQALATRGIALILEAIDASTNPTLEARDLVEQIFLGGVSHAAYAERKGISLMTVRMRISRMRKQLDAEQLYGIVNGDVEASV